MTKRTLGGTNRKRKRVSGFRVRMRSHTGRRVIRTRRKRGRARLDRLMVWDESRGFIPASASPNRIG